MYVVVLLAVAAAAVVAAAEPVARYDGHQVLAGRVETAAQAAAISALDVWHPADAADYHGLDVHVRVSPASRAHLDTLGFHYDVLIADVQAAVDAGGVQHAAAFDAAKIGTAANDEFFERYHTWDVMMNYYAELIAKNSERMAAQQIGESLEGRAIHGVRIAGKTQPLPKKAVYFQSGIHAREWVSPQVGAYIATRLVAEYETNETVRALLDAVTVYHSPLINPDGIVYTQTQRLWRKNRRRNAGGSVGVDLNRNFDSHWNMGGCGGPSSETYCGTAPASEPEVANVSSWLYALTASGVDFEAGFDYHSYSQLILRPWGFKREPPPNDADSSAMSNVYRDAVKAVHGETYKPQAAWQLYATSGTCRDWMYESTAAQPGPSMPFAYTIELRDTGRYGFVLPERFILPTAQENYAGFIAALDVVANGLP